MYIFRQGKKRCEGSCMYVSSFIPILSGRLYMTLFLVSLPRENIRSRVARVYNVPPARGSSESAETFISKVRGGTLSFPGFNGESLGPDMGQNETLFNIFSWEDSANREGLACLVFTYFLLFRILQCTDNNLEVLFSPFQCQWGSQIVIFDRAKNMEKRIVSYMDSYCKAQISDCVLIPLVIVQVLCMWAGY